MTPPSIDAAHAPAGIEYHGIPGATHPCVDAVLRLVQAGVEITEARLLSCEHEHAFVLTVPPGDHIAIKGGFASGYGGTAPNGLSFVLQLLSDLGTSLYDAEVTSAVLERLNQSALTNADLAAIVEGPSPRLTGRSWDDLINDQHRRWSDSGRLWHEFPLVMPYALIDLRLMDLARRFWSDPDQCLMSAYRRLESIVRARVSPTEQEGRLMATAFVGEKSVLAWRDIQGGEHVARGQLFTSAFGAYRNPRAHRERNERVRDQLAEFLLVNHLYELEATAVRRDTLPAVVPLATDTARPNVRRDPRSRERPSGDA